MENHPVAREYEQNCGLGGYEVLVSRSWVFGCNLVSGVWVDWVLGGEFGLVTVSHLSLVSPIFMSGVSLVLRGDPTHNSHKQGFQPAVR